MQFDTEARRAGMRHPVNRLVAFYRGAQPDHRGRTLDAILERDDDWLERTHDFIQWLFPLCEPSGVNPHVPLVDRAVCDAFAGDPALRDSLTLSLVRMLRFYGLERAGGAVSKGANWDDRRSNWFERDTHNNLRITRILKSLVLLGLPDEAMRLHAALEMLCDTEPGCGIGARSRTFWKEAAR